MQLAMFHGLSTIAVDGLLRVAVDLVIIEAI